MILAFGVETLKQKGARNLFKVFSNKHIASTVNRKAGSYRYQWTRSANNEVKPVFLELRCSDFDEPYSILANKMLVNFCQWLRSRVKFYVYGWKLIRYTIGKSVRRKLYIFKRENVVLCFYKLYYVTYLGSIFTYSVQSTLRD